ncbi:MAG TPA: Na+/H+ antiporter NhaA [Polyangiaceae bacterium]|nr:Na+/H+ antiporter NhaA [Polyangiaceae bacterium]
MDTLAPKASPREPEHRERGRLLFAVVAPFQAFFRLEAAGGLVMMASAALALIWANSPWRSAYEAIFRATIQAKVANWGIDWTVHHFTNDALMTLFFVVAGLEIKRELVHGELSSWGRASLPLVAAAGGMLVPALIYFSLNRSGPARAGWAVPMATDIAFALGCLALVKRRVPSPVFVFLTALAIFDDLGAMIVIALFYGGTVQPQMLLVSLLLAGVLLLLGRLRVQAILPYVGVGLLLWVAVLASGIHPTVAGVVIGLALPTTPRRAPLDVVDDLDEATTALRRQCAERGAAPEGTIAAIERHLESVQSPLDRAMHGLHGAVAFGIVPLFALANAGIELRGSSLLASSVTLGALLGLAIGKPLGVLGATWAAVKLRLAPRPTGSTWLQLLAVSLVAGVGFTMSLLVGNLGLGHTRGLEDQAKLGVLAGSIVSAALGLFVLRRYSPLTQSDVEQDQPVILDVPRFARGYGVRHCNVAGPLVDQTLRELDVGKRFGVTVIGIWRAGTPAGARKLEPIQAEDRMREGDVLLVAGTDAAVDDFVSFSRAGESP